MAAPVMVAGGLTRAPVRRLLEAVGEPAASLAVLAAMVAAAAVITASSGWGTTYAGASGAGTLLGLLVLLCLLLLGFSGLVGSTGDRSVGIASSVAAVTWLASDVEGWIGGSPPIRIVASVLSALYPASLSIVVWLVVARPPIRRPRAALLFVGLGLAAVGTVGRMVALGTATDPLCWSLCTGDPTAPPVWPAAAAWSDVLAQLGWALSGALMVATVVWAASGSGPGAWRRHRLLWIPSVIVGMLFMTHAVARAVRPVEGPAVPAFGLLWTATAFGTIALALAVVDAAARSRRLTRGLARLTDAMGDAGLGAREVLARVTGDPTLDIVYPFGPEGGYIGPSGAAVARPDPGGGRVTTTLVRAAVPQAVVTHDPARVEAVQLERALGSGARLALENERLRAEILARIAEVEASRARIIAAGDEARRRAERDLHDGAQQRLVALIYDLRVAAATAREHGASEIAAALNEEIQEAQTALDELRDLAHGLFPAILAEAGLWAAIESYSERSRLPLRLGPPLPGRCPSWVELTAYRTVVAAIEEASRQHARRASVRAWREQGRLLVEVKDDGFPGPRSLAEVADRIGTQGGSVTWSAETGESALEVSIPCG